MLRLEIAMLAQSGQKYQRYKTYSNQQTSSPTDAIMIPTVKIDVHIYEVQVIKNYHISTPKKRHMIICIICIN